MTKKATLKMDLKNLQLKQTIIKLNDNNVDENAVLTSTTDNIATSAYINDKQKILSTAEFFKIQSIILNKISNYDIKKGEYCNKINFRIIDKSINAQLAAVIQGCLNIRNICFKTPKNFSNETITDIYNYITNYNIKNSNKEEMYSIEFVTKNIKNTCSILSNKALDHFDKQLLGQLKNAFKDFKERLLPFYAEPQEVLEQLNVFIACYNNKNFLPKDFVLEIEINFIFDKIFNFVKFEVKPNFNDRRVSKIYNNMHIVYNQTLGFLFSNFVSESGIFKINETANYEKNHSFILKKNFNSKSKKHSTKREIFALLNTYKINENNHSKVYAIEFKNLTGEEKNVGIRKDVTILIGVVIMCTLIWIPLIIGIVVYCCVLLCIAVVQKGN